MRRFVKHGTVEGGPERKCRDMEGLTLVELLLALLLTGLILAAVYNLFGSQENTQVLVDQLSEMNQNLRIAANTILMDMRQAGYHVEGGVASSGLGQLRAIVVQDGGTTNPDELTVLYAIPGFEAKLTSSYSTPGGQASIDDGCPPVSGGITRTCHQSSPTCFCSGDLVIMTDGRTSSVFRVTSPARDGPTQLVLGTSSSYNDSDGHEGSGFPAGGYGEGSRVFKAVLRTYRVDRTTDPRLPRLRVTEGIAPEEISSNQTLVDGIEDLQISPTGANNHSYEVAITARTRKAVPGSGYRRRTITETVRVRNLQ